MIGFNDTGKSPGIFPDTPWVAVMYILQVKLERKNNYFTLLFLSFCFLVLLLFAELGGNS